MWISNTVLPRSIAPRFIAKILVCPDWSSDTVIDLIVEGRNRWSVVLIRIITCIYFSSDYICTLILSKICNLISCHKNVVLEEKA
jgi:hypothetical protein